jgi:hypothetical protein
VHGEDCLIGAILLLAGGIVTLCPISGTFDDRANIGLRHCAFWGASSEAVMASTHFIAIAESTSQ